MLVIELFRECYPRFIWWIWLVRSLLRWGYSVRVPRRGYCVPEFSDKNCMAFNGTQGCHVLSDGGC